MSEEKRELTCIRCPMGCQITVTLQDGEVAQVTGNTCPRGAEYARNEVTHPVRTVTSTVRVFDGELPVVPVKTATDIPKDGIAACMEAISRAKVTAPVSIGDVIIHDVAGLGADVIATKNISCVK